MNIELRPAFKDPAYHVYDGKKLVGEIRYDPVAQMLRFEEKHIILKKPFSSHDDTIEIVHNGTCDTVTVIKDTYRDSLVSDIGGQRLLVSPKSQYWSLTYTVFVDDAIIGIVKHAGFPGLKFKVQIDVPVTDDIVWASACFAAWSLFTGRHPDLRGISL